MSLRQNLTLLAQYPVRVCGGTLTASASAQARTMLGVRADNLLAPHASAAAWSKTDGLPTGWQFGNGWMPPQSGGGAWLANLHPASLDGVGAATAGLIPAKNALAAIAGTGDVTDAAANMIRWGGAMLAGSGDVVGAIAGGLQAVATLAGAGDLTGLLNSLVFIGASLEGAGDAAGILDMTLQAAAALAGEGTVAADVLGGLNATAILAGAGAASADVQGVRWGAAWLTGDGTLDAAVLALGHVLAVAAGAGAVTAGARATAAASAAIAATGEVLTPASIATAVWAADAAGNDGTGTMGEKLNDAGSAANPWTEVIESGYTAAEILRILAAVAAGKTEKNGTTRRFRDLGDTKDRVTGVVSDGDRTSVALEVGA